MNNVGVIGDRDSVIGFRALGMTVLEAGNAEEAGRHLKNLVAENFAVIFITENFVQGNEDYLLSVRSQKLPAIIPIPSISGSTGLGMRQVRESVRRAVGMDLLSQDEQS
ncbi:MAG: V-type ATP synthase subunit F [Saccharofermentanales bacterium]|jgi:V/A-type H+-transporting ATPase subunit F